MPNVGWHGSVRACVCVCQCLCVCVPMADSQHFQCAPNWESTWHTRSARVFWRFNSINAPFPVCASGTRRKLIRNTLKHTHTHTRTPTHTHSHSIGLQIKMSTKTNLRTFSMKKTTRICRRALKFSTKMPTSSSIFVRKMQSEMEGGRERERESRQQCPSKSVGEKPLRHRPTLWLSLSTSPQHFSLDKLTEFCWSGFQNWGGGGGTEVGCGTADKWH